MIQDFLIGALGFVLAFGLAVFVHELGHFLFAKLFGVGVERFVIGFDREAMPFLPRCIWERKFGDTTYGLSLIPIGGYVKMSGNLHPEVQKYFDGEDAPADGMAGQSLLDQAALYRKPFWQKFLIYAGGAMMNFLLAMAVIAVVSMRGLEREHPLPAIVAWQEPGNPLAALGPRTGDRIVAVSNAIVANDAEYYAALGPFYEKETTSTISLSYLRENESEPRRTDFDFYPNSELSRALASAISTPAYIRHVNPNFPADKAGIKDHDYVLAVNGERIHDWQHFTHLIRSNAKREMQLEIRRGETTTTLAVTPWESADKKGQGQLGILNGNPNVEWVRLSFAAAVSEAPQRLLTYMGRYLENMAELGRKIVTGNVKALHREVSGPVGIAQVAARAAQKGMSDWLRFIIILNIALGMMNLLPIPVLDGGHIVFAAWEGIFSKPLNPALFLRILNTFVLLFIGFFVFVTFSDVFKIFG